MSHYISDAELSRVIRQRIKQATEELGGNKTLARKEAINYIEELLAELITEERNKPCLNK
jgi:hypothetical protein